MTNNDKTGNIYQAMAAMMADVDAIGKKQRNAQQGFNFRGIDDVYNAVHPLLAKNGIFCTPEVLTERTEDRTTAKGSHLIYRVLTIRYTFWAADGSSVSATVIGEGMDSGDKAANKAMAVAHKYALLQTLCIPTEDMVDPDSEVHPPSTPAKAAEPAKPAGNRRELVSQIVEVYKSAAFTDEQRKGLKATLSELKTDSQLEKFLDEAGKHAVAAGKTPDDIF